MLCCPKSLSEILVPFSLRRPAARNRCPKKDTLCPNLLSEFVDHISYCFSHKREFRTRLETARNFGRRFRPAGGASGLGWRGMGKFLHSYLEWPPSCKSRLQSQSEQILHAKRNISDAFSALVSGDRDCQSRSLSDVIHERNVGIRPFNERITQDHKVSIR